MSSARTSMAVDRIHSLDLTGTELVTHTHKIMKSTGRKVGKQKSPILKGRTSGRKVFAKPTPGQQLLIDRAAKRGTILA